MGTDEPIDPPAYRGAADEEAKRTQVGQHREAGRAGRGKTDQDDVARHVGREDVPEPQIAHGIEEAADHSQRGQRGHE